MIAKPGDKLELGMGGTSVDVPFVGEDAEGDIDLDVFYSSFVPDCLPGELIIRFPC
jgi:hypothetical protein